MPPWFVVALGVGGRVACGELYGLFIPLLLRIWYTFFFARYNREVSPKPLMRLLFPFLIHSYNVHCSFFCSCATFKRSVFKDIIPNHCSFSLHSSRLAGVVWWFYLIDGALVVSLGAYITYWFPLPSSHILYPSGNTPITLSLSALACFSGYVRSFITYFIFCYRAAGVARINDSMGLYALASLCASQLAFKP